MVGPIGLIIVVTFIIFVISTEFFRYDGSEVIIKKDRLAIRPVDFYLSNQVTRDGIVKDCNEDPINKRRHLIAIRRLLKQKELTINEYAILLKFEESIKIGRSTTMYEEVINSLNRQLDQEKTKNSLLVEQIKKKQNEIKKFESQRRYRKSGK